VGKYFYDAIRRVLIQKAGWTTSLPGMIRRASEGSCLQIRSS
jgi:hypothetical protein